jgi:hypothetical protein
MDCRRAELLIFCYPKINMQNEKQPLGMVVDAVEQTLHLSRIHQRKVIAVLCAAAIGSGGLLAGYELPRDNSTPESASDEMALSIGLIANKAAGVQTVLPPKKYIQPESPVHHVKLHPKVTAHAALQPKKPERHIKLALHRPKAQRAVFHQKHHLKKHHQVTHKPVEPAIINYGRVKCGFGSLVQRRPIYATPPISPSRHQNVSLRDLPIASHNIALACPDSPKVMIRDAKGLPLRDPEGRAYRAGDEYLIQVQSIGPAILSENGHLMVWSWGTNNKRHSPTGKSGFIYASQLKGISLPGNHMIPSRVITSIAGNSRPIYGKLAKVTRMQVAPSKIQGHFKPVRTKINTKVRPLKTYGMKDGNPRYAYLASNVPDVAGGGVVRSILTRGEDFYASRLKKQLPIVDERGKSIGEQSTWIYGYAQQNKQKAWGWVLSKNIQPAEQATTIPNDSGN